MEENNELMTIEETNELEEYEESSCNSGLLNLAIGIGIGAVGTLLAKKGVSKFKSWCKRKTEEIVQQTMLTESTHTIKICLTLWKISLTKTAKSKRATKIGQK